MALEVDVGSFLLQKVERNHAELEACAAAEEEHVVTLGDIEKLFGEGHSFVHYSLELLATVGNFKNRETGVCEIKHCVGSLLDCVLAQDTGTCIEIVLFHV